MKKFGKGVIKIAIIIIALMAMCFSTKVQASELTVVEPVKTFFARGGGSLSDIINAGNSFITQGKSGAGAVKNHEQFAEELAPIGSIIAGVGVVIFMGVLAVMAIKWIVAKPDDKAKLKQAFVGYVIAAFVFFGAIGIWRLAIQIMESIQSEI